MGFYWSYTLLLKLVVLMHSCSSHVIWVVVHHGKDTIDGQVHLMPVFIASVFHLQW